MTGLAGLGLFLFGLWLLEQGLEQLAGRSFKTLLRNQTDRPLKAILAGILATVVLQSSSVVTLILLALVGAGIIGLSNALGIVFGANLGTTATGWVVALVGFEVEVETWVLPLVAAGSLLFVFAEGSYSRLASWGRAILGFGLLLFGLTMIKDGMGGVADQVDLVQYAAWGAVPFALAGFVFTAIVQSSSATMVITLAALDAGVIELGSAAALVIGADLGTTITVMIGGIRGSATRKQVALGHFLFNLITDVIALALLPLLLPLVLLLVGPDKPLVALVAFHSSFNLLGIALFLPFIGRFAGFLERRYQRDDALPPGFEGVLDADPRFPPAAIDVLDHATHAFLRAACALNRHALRMDRPVGLQATLLGERDFMDRYRELKEVQGHLVALAGKLGAHALEPDQGARLSRLERAILDGGQSAKELRDVESNLRSLEASPAPGQLERLRALQQTQGRVYSRLLALLDAPGEAARTVATILDENRAAYEAEVAAAYAPPRSERAIPALALTDRLNLAREVYVSTKRLVVAFAELVLEPEELARFETLPNR